ncbi:RING-type E3 ubiquitin-protein ligase PPIL2 [Rhopalosiphum padi]|uniref:RING-type E3 ubiquitin-protein ligase PPIL2 n=1 Tax=Rhopalosiphum padi TaxID=40932 RepID=UPI00298EC3F1|nr:RING-type E3 ubiquitin-protein ligase PPIL2 [Rhopalosiphum padi]
MGKRQHQKDKMYLTYTEWSTLYGGKRPGIEKPKFARLPFDHCCLSLVAFKTPYCDPDGNIFEYEALLEYIKQFKHNPVTGKAIELKKLIKLNFHRNAAGEYHCPVLFKSLTKHSHIVAIKTTGNVFSYEAIEQLNIKTKNWKDLLTDEPFLRKDMITLQDPTNLTKFNIAKFHHVVKKIKVVDPDEEAQSKDPEGRLKSVSKTTRDILDTLDRDYKEPAKKVDEVAQKPDKLNTAHYSTGRVAASFTSTAMVPVLEHESAIIEENEIRFERIKKKGYVRLTTNYGPLNLELFCKEVPKTCENFIKLCQKDYYNGTKFHRSIRNFMVQGGDPTGTGKGGESYWGQPFEDEFKQNLNHSGRGVLSMANSGPDTNKSQFFITYRSCKHLDNKHTVFGRIVGGFETLNAIEEIEVDNKDRPITDINILQTHVFVDPFQEVDDKIAEERQEALINTPGTSVASNVQTEENKISSIAIPGVKLKTFKSGVGKYINPSALQKNKIENEELPNKKKKVVGYDFHGFNNW